jgi:hypothetical protein
MDEVTVLKTAGSQALEVQFLWPPPKGHHAEWIGTCLQNRRRGFDSLGGLSVIYLFKMPVKFDTQWIRTPIDNL